ncbi:redox-sensing transcriptional repressor Rex [Mesoaciditoga lauensis]|uniref:redox-sensing transcriptional repressor Rex n=1 Tax=Mesoaciditoga lauensis TaxID=1495039 RepID=UPI0005609556|nr:redox-sensing transcriptional repressor Rex [Mesoaciditoga lauensis]
MESKKSKIPSPVAKRLALYHRCVETLLKSGKEMISSKELGERLSIKSSQIRKDLSYFGGFGKRGSGYNLNYLKDALENIMGINRTWNVGVVGAGNIGTALANYQGLLKDGYKIVALFDRNDKKVGKTVGPRKVPIFHVNEMCQKIRELSIEIGVIAVPAEYAQSVADRLVKCAEIKGIINFAPVKIYVEKVDLEDVDISISFKSLTFKIWSEVIGRK